MPPIQCIKCLNLFKQFHVISSLYIVLPEMPENAGKLEVVTDLDDDFNNQIDESEGSLKNDDYNTNSMIPAHFHDVTYDHI